MTDHVYIVLDTTGKGGGALVFNWVWRDRKEAEDYRERYLEESGRSRLDVVITSLRLVPETS